jgi:hypothetical protein
MWEDYEFNTELLQDAVTELESERLALKRTLKLRDNFIKDLKAKQRYYDVSGDIYKEPKIMELNSQLSVKLHSSNNDVHVVGKDNANGKIIFSYYATLDPKMSEKRKAGILTYLHRKVMEELSKNLS